jgi:hypothetical protein
MTFFDSALVFCDIEATEDKGAVKKGHNTRLVITPLHPDVVRFTKRAPERDQLTKRMKREQRARLASNTRRLFTEDPDQACGVCNGVQD